MFLSSLFTRETFEPRIAQSQLDSLRTAGREKLLKATRCGMFFGFFDSFFSPSLLSFFFSLLFQFSFLSDDFVYLAGPRPLFLPFRTLLYSPSFCVWFSSRRIYNAPRVHPAAFKTANPAIPAALCRYSPPPTPCPEVSFPAFPERRETATPRPAPSIRTESTAVPA